MLGVPGLFVCLFSYSPGLYSALPTLSVLYPLQGSGASLGGYTALAVTYSLNASLGGYNSSCIILSMLHAVHGFSSYSSIILSTRHSVATAVVSCMIHALFPRLTHSIRAPRPVLIEFSSPFLPLHAGASPAFCKGGFTKVM